MQGKMLRRRAAAVPLAALLLAGGVVIGRSALSEAETAGTISTYAGAAGCAGAATTVSYPVDPRAVVVDGAGHLFVGEFNRILRIDKTTKAVTQVDVPAFDRLQELAIDGAGNLYALVGPDAPGSPRTVVQVTAAGAASTVWNPGPPVGSSPQVSPNSMAVSSAGWIYLGDGSKVIRVKGGVEESVVAPNTPVNVGTVGGLAVDPAGNLYVADATNATVMKVMGGVASGGITKFAGGVLTFPTYPYQAMNASVRAGTMAVDAAGSLLLTESGRHQVTKVTAVGGQGGQLSLVAGNGGGSVSCLGDGGLGSQAQLNLGDITGGGVDVDPTTGDVYVADAGNNRIRRVAGGAAAGPTGKGTGPGAAKVPDPPVIIPDEQYQALTPKRVIDTRPGSAVGTANPTRIVGGTSIDVDVAGPLGKTAADVAGAAVVLNVTGILPSAQTYLQVFPSGEARPLSSNLYLNPQQTLPNLVVAKVGANGKVSIFNAAGTVDVAADLMGFYPSASDYKAVTPKRVLDTRPGVAVGVAAGRVGQGQSIVADLRSQGVPPDAGAVVLNVTAINPTAESYVSVFPANGAQPFVSNLNFSPNETIPNLVIVKLDSEGKVRLFNAVGSVDLAADLLGYISGDSAAFTGVLPARVYDTRVSGGPMQAGETIELPMRGTGGVPAGAKAVVVNVTAADITGESYLAVYPGDAAQPNASNLYLTPGDVVPNLVIAKLSATGTIKIFNAANSANVIVDVMGFMT